MKASILKLNFAVLLLVFTTVSASGQTSLRLGLMKGNTEWAHRINQTDSYIEKSTYMPYIDVTHELLPNFDLGFYLAYSTMEHNIPLQQDSTGMYVLVDNKGVRRYWSSSPYYGSDTRTLFYGFSGRYHLIEPVTGLSNVRFDLYAVSKLGLVSANWTDFDGADFRQVWQKPQLEYSLGIGGGYAFTKRLGFYFEYSWGKLYNEGKNNFNTGLVYRFK